MKLKIFSLLLTLFTFFIPLNNNSYFSNNSEKTFGYTTGQFNVTDAGSATYSIPFILPPGTGGMTPQIGMAYSSQGGNGLMGVGWSLQGISTISRSTHTLAQDDKIKGINVNSSDTYSMDGERLMPIFGQNGATTTEYRTEQNAFIKIVSYGNVKGSPEKFRVWTKAGLIMEYGYTSDSRIEAQNSQEVLFWVVNKIIDTKGNTIQFFYQENNNIGEYYPIRIDYTSNIRAGLVPYNSVRFKYSNRPDNTPKFVAGYQLQSNKVLTAVEAYHKNDLARAYHFKYEHGETTGVCRLKSVQECGTDGTCFKPTVFKWKKEKQLSFQKKVGFPQNEWKSVEDQLLQGDWDGDGKIDFMRFKSRTGETVFYKNDGKFNFKQTAKASSLLKKLLRGKRLHLADFNADGFTDIMAYHPINGLNVWFLNNGKSFSQLDFRDTKLTTVSPEKIKIANNEPVILNFMDWNGDGRTDLMTYHKKTGKNNFYFNQSDKQTLRFTFQESPINNSIIKNGEGIYPGDWNGDGLADILWYDKKTGTNRWIINTAQGAATRISFETPIVNKIPAEEIKEGMGIHFGNWNGDGLTDIMWYDKKLNNGKWWGNKGNLKFEKMRVSGALTSHLNEKDRILFLDYNGDGADDLMIQQENGFNLWFQNDGQLNFAKPLQNPGGINLPFDKNRPSYQITVPGSYGETGILDLFYWHKNNGVNHFYCTHLATSNIIDNITQGNGAAIDIHYRPITNPEVYTKESSAIYPEFDFQTKFFVVCDFQVDNGIGGKSKMVYQYKGAKMDLRGRGFRGFKEVVTTDKTSGIITKRFYNRGHQYISSPLLKSTTQLADGRLINEMINKPVIVDYFKSGRKRVQFSHTAESITRNYELDGKLISEIKTTQKMDDFGNVKTMTIDYGNGYKDITKNTYDTGNKFRKQFILGRLSRSEVTRIAPRQEPVIKVAAFEYDVQSGLLTKEITEPDRPIEERIEKIYEHDPFGNILKSTTTFYNGKELESRSITTTYDKTGRFLLKTTNDLGHSSTTTYDPLLGHTLSETDINGLTATNEYDGFGRVIKTTLPDGNWSAQAFVPCESGDCPPNAIFYLKKTSSVNPIIKEYYDLLGREIQTTTIGFDGQVVFQKNNFNNKGLVIQKSEPHYSNESPNWVKMEYDVLGRERKIIATGNRVSETRYDGLKTTFINPKFQKRIIQKNVLDQLLSVTDNQGNKIKYSYSPTGNMTEMIDPKGNIIQLEYDHLGNRIALHDPDMGSYFYDYNSIGELIGQTDPKGNSIELDYDQLGRMIQRIEPEGITNWLYDTKEMGLGKLASMESTDYDYSSELIYDKLGRVKKSKETIVGKTYQISSSYDGKGRLQILDYPSSFTVRYVYNEHNYLAEVRNANTNQLYWKANTTNAKGQLIQQTLGNNTQSTFEYNAKTNWLESIQTNNSGKDKIQDLNYVYDNLGNIVFRHNKLQNAAERFSYDKLNRLISTEVKGQDKIHIEYDLLGNIIKKSDVGRYFYGENNTGPHQLSKIVGLDGNEPCPPSAKADFVYTSFNKVKQIEKDSFRQELFYSPSRSRTVQKYYLHGKLVKTKIHIGSLLEVEITDTLTRELYYIRGNGGVIAVHNEQTKGKAFTHYWHKDHLGSVQSVTNQAAAIVQVLSFDAWGKRRNADGSPIVQREFEYDRGFTGHEHIDWFDLINMNGRIYDPVIGRFISPDPFIQAPDNLQSWNRYAYVLNNPLNHTDPSGYFSLRKTVKKWGRSIKKRFNRTIRDIGHFLKDNWKTIAVVAATIAVSLLTWGAATPLVATMLSGAAAGFVGGALGTILAGGGVSDALSAGIKGAVIGGITAGLTYGIGNLSGNIAFGTAYNSGSSAAGQLAGYGVKMVGHGVVQGLKAELNGGKFRHGFISGSVTGGGEYFMGNNKLLNVFMGAGIGGTASELGGGKFSNGAISGAMVALYNRSSTSGMEKRANEGLNFLRASAVISGKIGLAVTFLGLVVTTPIAAPLLLAGGIVTTTYSATIYFATSIGEAAQGNYSQAATDLFESGMSLVPIDPKIQIFLDLGPSTPFKQNIEQKTPILH